VAERVHIRLRICALDEVSGSGDCDDYKVSELHLRPPHDPECVRQCLDVVGFTRRVDRLVAPLDRR
jgi:hypothetical protein